MISPVDPQQSFTIGEAAERIGTSVETIRLYERRGLIITSKNGGNQRVFSLEDIERLECIRKEINDRKISIEGIRRMQSLVPCWEHIGCPVERREKCPAYFRTDAGCWTYEDKQADCIERSCRDCMVYRLSGDCEKIKSLIHHNALPGPDNDGQQG